MPSGTPWSYGPLLPQRLSATQHPPWDGPTNENFCVHMPEYLPLMHLDVYINTCMLASFFKCHLGSINSQTARVSLQNGNVTLG